MKEKREKREKEREDRKRKKEERKKEKRKEERQREKEGTRDNIRFYSTFFPFLFCSFLVVRSDEIDRGCGLPSPTNRRELEQMSPVREQSWQRVSTAGTPGLATTIPISSYWHTGFTLGEVGAC